MEVTEAGRRLELIQVELGLSGRELAQKLDCSISTIERLVNGKTAPTEEMENRIDHFLSNEGDSELWEKIGALGGAGTGVALASTAVTAVGVGAGAATVTSGLAAVGTVVGGGMVAGLGVVAAAPVAAGLAGWGAVKGVKWLLSEDKTDKTEFDSQLEAFRDPD